MPINGLSRKLDIGAVILAYSLSSWMLYALTQGSGLNPVEAAKQGQAGPQMIWSILYLYILVRALQNGKAILQRIISHKLILLLPLLAFASFAWSQAPATVIRRSTALLLTYLFGAFISVKFSIRQQLIMLSGVLLTAACASYVVELAFPGAIKPIVVIPGMWNGVFAHKNYLSQFMLLGVVSLGCLLVIGVQHRIAILLGMALCLGLVFLSRSATGIVVSVGLATSYLIVRANRGSARSAIPRLLVIGALVASASIYASIHSDNLLNLLGKSSTLTGRTAIWEYSLLSVAKHPLFGYGYSAFWHVNNEAMNVIEMLPNHWDAPGAHNGYIDTMLQLGVVGLVLLFFTLLTVLVRAIRQYGFQRNSAALWPLMLTLFLLGTGLSESSCFMGDNALYWFLFTAAAFGSSWQ